MYSGNLQGTAFFGIVPVGHAVQNHAFYRYLG